jgi:hypothetical protein
VAREDWVTWVEDISMTRKMAEVKGVLAGLYLLVYKPRWARVRTRPNVVEHVSESI